MCGCGEPLYGFSPCRWCTCERCGVDLRNGICPLCNLSNSCADDHNPNSFDCPPDSYHPPHPTHETYLGDSCGNDSQSGYDCPPQFPLNYEPEPGYTQNYNSCPHDSSSFPQQYPSCEDCGVTHEPYQCQPKNHDYYDEQNSCYDSNSFGFDQIQTPQYTVNHQIFNAHNDLLNSQNRLMEQMTSICEMVGQLIQKNKKKSKFKKIKRLMLDIGRSPLTMMMTTIIILKSHLMNPLTLSVWGLSILTLFRQRNRTNS
nr:hypothetical protein [Tanacetum cinerariifolium]